MPEKTTDRIPGWQGGNAEGARGLGADLRARRDELGWALPDVANWLRIRETYLRALEEGNLSVFPGSAYALGFLRSYAHALGMDPDQAVARFRQDARGALAAKPELSFPEPVSERGVPVGLWVGAGLAVLVGTYIGYYHFFGADPAPTHQMPPVAEIMPGVTQHGTTSPQIAAVMPDRGLAPSPQLAPAQTNAAQAGTGQGNAASPDNAGNAVQGAANQPGAVPLPAHAIPAEQNGQQSAALTPAPATVAPPLPSTGMTPSNATTPAVPAPAAAATPDTANPVATTAASPAANMIVLHAGADAWVSIRDKNNATVFSRVLKSGETWQGPEENGPYHMTLGNAGGLTLSAGDVTTAALGRVGAVRRNLTVTADAIRSGQLGQEGSVVAAPMPGNVSSGPAQGLPGQSALPQHDETQNGDTSRATGAPAALKKTGAAPKVTAAEHESETDRLNRSQLEKTAQPR
ncbi:hypothetical protein C0V97_10595 [Asaia sp. W19]|uniref:helix-turn-helix domain-containing protein n=1 Tax=unclassified Asaia TaxID=2685023 RepID=UPI000F8C59D3|nr:helix-turn-helix domain-containing protein [Asaia sp. W19]RUT25569.1 hypothetical protein C0V97_10595 [Asaia sp. W19]